MVSYRKQEDPTASELKVMAGDQEHLKISESMLGQEDVARRVISIDLEQYELNHSIPLEVA